MTESRSAHAGPRWRPGRVGAGRVGPRVGLAALTACIALASACGSSSLDSSTVQLQDETEVSAQQYLADTSAAVVAIGEFSATLDALGEEPNRTQMQAAANALAGPLADTRVAAQRLEAARLADSRLESQRADTARSMNITVTRMAAVLAAAEAGDLPALRSASSAYGEALVGLRAAGETSLAGV